MVEAEVDNSNISLQVQREGLSRKQNNPQLLVCYIANATGRNNNTTTAIDTDGQGTSGASNRGARGKEPIQRYPKYEQNNHFIKP